MNVMLIFTQLLTKIQLADSKIIVRSFWRGDQELDWKDVKTVGVYTLSRYEYKLLEKEQYTHFLWGRQKFIYVSVKEKFIPVRYKKERKGYIEFHYRSDVYLEIEKRILENAARQ